MKQALFLFACLGIFSLVLQAQFTKSAVSTTRSSTMTKAEPVNAALITGSWAGTQTNMSGLYPGSIAFQLTTDGQITMGTSQNGTYPVIGTYAISGNSVTGTYRQASSGDVFSFALTYDAASQTLNGTIGTGTATTGHGKWTASKSAETLKPQGTVTVAQKGARAGSTTAGNSQAPPPPPPAKITSPLGTWTSLVRFTADGPRYDHYVIFFRPKGDIRIAERTQYNSLHTVGWGTYSIEGNKYTGMLNFFTTDNTSESSAHFYSATLDKNRLIGTMATLNGNMPGDFVMTFDPAPTAGPSISFGAYADDRCWGSVPEEYYLVDARIRFYTGNDNKELESRVITQLYVNGSIDQKSSSTPIFTNTTIENSLKGEFKPNSETVYPLDPYYMPCRGDRGENEPKNVSLSFINTFGLSFLVNYTPNFLTDAWKIEKVELILHFQKPDGTPHPTLGDKVIPFMNSSVLLNDGKRSVRFYTDRFLMPKL